eukprot:3203584-Amphidinium_carterae.1
MTSNKREVDCSPTKFWCQGVDSTIPSKPQFNKTVNMVSPSSLLRTVTQERVMEMSVELIVDVP